MRASLSSRSSSRGRESRKERTHREASLQDMVLGDSMVGTRDWDKPN